MFSVVLAGARRLRAQTILATVITLLFSLSPVIFPSVAQAQILGGFLEMPLNLSTAVEPMLSTTEINSFLPSKGKFRFPAPYNTEAVRLTNAADCGGQDCVSAIGYSYWRNINNHAGQSTMLIMIGFNQSRGGKGLSLLEYNKTTGAVTNRGPLFDANSPYGWASGEGWYFSATLPTKMYLNSGSKIMRYDVLSKQLETVIDVTTQLGAGHIVHQIHSSSDDLVHSATIRNSSTYAMLGCMVYQTNTNKFQFFAKKGDYDECQVDKSGKWLVIKENVDGVEGEDNRIINLETGNERLLRDSAGAGGHSDLGHGYMIANDNWAAAPNTWKVWDFNKTTLSGVTVYANNDWNAGMPNHVTHTNASRTAPSEQFSCGSSANRRNSSHANEIICFKLDGSSRTLVVAPVMTNLDSRPGDDYNNMPKGNLDVTGEYFIWTSNMGGSRLDAFLVRVPSQLLTGSSPITEPAPAPAPTPTPTPTPVPGDTTAPVISGIGTSQITTTSAAVTWTSNEPANGSIEYGTTTAYGQSASLGLSLSTSHFHTLTGLTAGTMYHYRVRSADAAGNFSYSADRSFTTTSLNDQAPPLVELTAPENDAMKAGVIELTATASDDTGIAGVQFQVDGINVGAEDTTAPYAVDWDSVGQSGQHTIRAIARDAAGKKTTSGSVSLRLLNRDTVVPVISGVTAVNVSGTTATIKWTTNELVQQRVEFGTTLKYSRATAINMEYHNVHEVNLVGLEVGKLYHYRVRSRDFAGNIATSQDFTFTAGVATAPVTPPSTDTTSPVTTAPGETVNWTNLVNVTVNGDVLQKTGSCDGCPDAGAVSVEQIASGNGYFEFPVTIETSKLRTAGLTAVGSNDIAYGFTISGTAVEVRENRVYRSDTTVAAGDLLRVTVKNGIVTYSKNGVAFYTSTVPVTAPVRGAALFYSTGGSIRGAVVKTQ